MFLLCIACALIWYRPYCPSFDSDIRKPKYNFKVCIFLYRIILGLADNEHHAGLHCSARWVSSAGEAEHTCTSTSPSLYMPAQSFKSKVDPMLPPCLDISLFVWDKPSMNNILQARVFRCSQYREAPTPGIPDYQSHHTCIGSFSVDSSVDGQ